MSKKQYDREIWRTKKETGQKGYDSAAALSELNRKLNRNRNLVVTQETPAKASTSAMEYIASLEERSAIQDKKIAELENHGRTVSIPPPTQRR